MTTANDPPRETEAELRGLCARAATTIENGHRFLRLISNITYRPEDQAATLDFVAKLRKAGAR